VAHQPIVVFAATDGAQREGQAGEQRGEHDDQSRRLEPRALEGRLGGHHLGDQRQPIGRFDAHRGVCLDHIGRADPADSMTIAFALNGDGGSSQRFEERAGHRLVCLEAAHREQAVTPAKLELQLLGPRRGWSGRC